MASNFQQFFGGGGSDIKASLNLTSGIAASKNTKVTLESNAKLGLALNEELTISNDGWNNSAPQIISIAKTTTNKWLAIAKDTNTNNSVYYSVYDTDGAVLRDWSVLYGNIGLGYVPCRIYHLDNDRFLFSSVISTGVPHVSLYRFVDASNVITRDAFQGLETAQGNSTNNLCDIAIDTTRDLVIGICSAGASNTPFRVRTFSGYDSGNLTKEGADQDYTTTKVNQLQFLECAYDPVTDAVYMVCSRDTINDTTFEYFKFTYDGTQYSQSGTSVIPSAGATIRFYDYIYTKQAFIANGKFVFKFSTSDNSKHQINTLSTNAGQINTALQFERYPYAMNSGNYRSDIFNVSGKIYTVTIDTANSQNDKIFRSDIIKIPNLFNLADTETEDTASPFNYANSSRESISLIPVANTNKVAFVYVDRSSSPDTPVFIIFPATECFFSEGETLGVLKDNATVDANVDVLLEANLQGLLVDQDNTNNTIGQALSDGSIPISATQTLKPFSADVTKSVRPFKLSNRFQLASQITLLNTSLKTEVNSLILRYFNTSSATVTSIEIIDGNTTYELVGNNIDFQEFNQITVPINYINTGQLTIRATGNASAIYAWLCYKEIN